MSLVVQVKQMRFGRSSVFLKTTGPFCYPPLADANSHRSEEWQQEYLKHYRDR
jgi:hypothetical protein